jgi:hypothetical protein
MVSHIAYKVLQLKKRKFSWMLRRVALVRTDVSEERVSCIIIMTRIGVLRLLVTPNIVSSSPILLTLMMKELGYSETSVLTRATQPNTPEDGILHSHHRENLKPYIALTGCAL